MDHATVAAIPDCDVCKLKGKKRLAYADAMIPTYRRWGYVCTDCFAGHGCGLGLGRGQVLHTD